MMDWDLKNEILHDLYQLQRQQHLESTQVNDRHHHPPMTKDYGMAVFSVLPPQLPSAPQASTMRGRLYRSVSLKLLQTFTNLSPICTSY